MSRCDDRLPPTGSTADPAVLRSGAQFPRHVALAGVRLPVAWIASQNVLPVEFWVLGRTTPQGIWIAFLVSNVVGAAIAWL